jgi:aryl-alcohol dehydrogenase-like predicted oxidoreductase
MVKLQRFGLGTVQFGQTYGISNTRGQVPLGEVGAILRRARDAGISVLDTAAGYGDAENILGSLRTLTTPFRIVTKTIPLKHGLDAVLARARQSCRTLGREPVDLLLVHSAADLLAPEGHELWQALLGLRDEGLFGGIGISAYVADDPVALARKFRPTAVQVPVSILDQRLIESGALSALKELGVEIHARSLFLQGLLFLEENALPPKLKSAAPHLAALRRRIAEAESTPLAAALSFALDRPQIDVAVVGVTALSELDEILEAAALPKAKLDWEACALNDPVVLTPSLW